MSDLISREALKEVLKTEIENIQPLCKDSNYFIGVKQGLKFAETVIDNAPSQWIPVSERLPEALQTVLVTSKGGYVYTSCIVHGEWEYGGEVIAWQPLPEPYQKSGAT